MTYVLADPHGYYEKYRNILSQISFKEDDVMYILGDLVDFGDEPMELIADLSVRLNVFPIAGNHDFRAAKLLRGLDAMLREGSQPDAEFIAEMTDWIKHGGQHTVEGFRALDNDEREGVLEYFDDMTLFEEVEVKGKNYLLVHAGIADYDPDTDLEDYEPEDFFDVELDASRPLISGTTVVVGHKATESGKIEYGEGSIFLDCGVQNGGKLACLCLETGKEYYA